MKCSLNAPEDLKGSLTGHVTIRHQDQMHKRNTETDSDTSIHVGTPESRGSFAAALNISMKAAMTTTTTLRKRILDRYEES